jgi:hypothetical protein
MKTKYGLPIRLRFSIEDMDVFQVSHIPGYLYTSHFISHKEWSPPYPRKAQQTPVRPLGRTSFSSHFNRKEKKVFRIIFRRALLNQYDYRQPLGK